MRNITDLNEEKSRSMKLLEEAAQAAKKPSQVEQRLAKLEQEMQLTRYAIGNLFKVLNDLPNIKAQVEQLDYRTLGVIRAVKDGLCANFTEMVEAAAKASRNEVFWELSNKDDIDRNLADAGSEPLTDSSHMIFTTECESDPDQAVFRSKMDLACDEFKDFRDLFIGKTVGDKVNMMITGKEHVATILATRKKSDANQ